MLLAFVATAFAAEAARKNFKLPAGKAGETLKQFAAQAGREIVFAPEAIGTVPTKAVSGSFGPHEALDLMLEGSGLVASQDAKTGAFAVRKGAADPNGEGTAPAPAASARLPSSRDPAIEMTAETIELSPFVVTGEKDDGYLAGNTLAGSRLNTPLRDTAASLSVMTEEFIKDIGATTLTEAIEYGNNIQLERDDGGSFGDSPAGNPIVEFFDTYRVRGMKATVARNYFPWMLTTDAYNVGRIEEARGPNSILFGIGSAGGIINSTTKQANPTRTFASGTLGFAVNDSYRGTLDFNQSALRGKLGLRLNAVHNHAGSHRLFAFSDNDRMHLAAKYLIGSKTRLRAEYETGRIDEVIPRTGDVMDGAYTWVNAGRPLFATGSPANSTLRLALYPATRRVVFVGNNSQLMDWSSTNYTTATNNMIESEIRTDRSVNTGGPGQTRNSYYNATSVFFEQQLARNTFLELSYNHQDYKYVAHQSFGGTGGNITGDPNLTLRTGQANPRGGQLYLESNWVRRLREERSDIYRAILSTEADFGRWGRYRLAAMGEDEVKNYFNHGLIEAWAGGTFSTTSPEGTANQVFRRNYVTEGDWATYYVNAPTVNGLIKNVVEPVTGRTLSSTWVTQNSNTPTDEPTWQRVLLLSGQARYFNNRLVAGVGFRRDRVTTIDRITVRDPATYEYVVDYGSATSTRWDIGGTTRTLGLVGHAGRGLSLHYNRSSNLALPDQRIRLNPDNRVGTSPQGEGEDFGVALELFRGRVYARATRYETAQKGIQSFLFGGTYSRPESICNLILQGLLNANLITPAERTSKMAYGNGAQTDVASRGYEFSVTANPTKAWRLQANYSITDTINDNIAPEIFAWAATAVPYFRTFPQNTKSSGAYTIGEVVDLFEAELANQTSVQGVGVVGGRRHKVNVFTRYQFERGWLRGLRLGGGYRHMSRMLIGRDNWGNLQYGNSYWMADGHLGYTIRRLAFLKRFDLQLNVQNVFDLRTELVQRISADNSVVKRRSILAPRMWRLTSSFDF